MSRIEANMENEQQNLLKEDPNFILDQFINEKISITSLLNTQKLNSTQLMTSLTIIHKACMLTNNANSISNLLCKIASSKEYFITAVSVLAGKKLSCIEVIENDFLDIIVDLLQMLVQRVPTASMNILEILLPQLLEVCKKCEDKEYIFSKLEELEKQKGAYIAVIQNKEKSARSFAASFNISLLPNVPSYEEMSLDKPFLRPAIIDGPFTDAEHYLDIHVRLMREDMFRDFRKCLTDFHSCRKLENGRLYHNARIDRVQQTENGKFFHFAVPVRSKVDWKRTKRLAPGSLLCLSCDGFKDFYFASIHSRKDDDYHGNICCLILGLQSVKEPTEFLRLYDIIETGGYYETYSHVFEKLKNLSSSNFPCRSRLLDYKGCSDPPFFLHPEQEVCLKDFQTQINDDNQNLAFELALKNKIALIQGPPGTGKSYLGVQIARYLTQIADIKKPVIVMCYTNHALDQFLEKMLDFTTKIVRIGGRSKSEKLELYNLSNLSRSKNYEQMRILRLDLNTPYESDENLEKSFEIFKNMHDGRDLFEDQYPGWLYGKVKREGEILTQYLTDHMKIMIYPFTKTTMDLRLCDIRGLRDALTNGKLKGNIFNTVLLSAEKIKIYLWLMTDSLFSNVYNDMADFKKMLTEELFDAFQLIGILKKKNDDKETMTPKSDHLTSLLVRLCIKDKPDSFFKQYGSSRPEIEKFVQAHMTSNEVLFPLFFRAALRCTEKNFITVNEQCNDLWSLDLYERWKLLSTLLFQVAAFDITERLKCKTFTDSVRRIGTDGILTSVGSHEKFDIKRYEEDCKDLKSHQIQRDAHLLQGADIIGITTTGAAKNFHLLSEIKPTTYIVEEAAEVFESHIVASLSSNIEHLILIGDHFQLRPAPNVYDLAVKYHLDVSLFERLFKNSVPSVCLTFQHRMRPSIAKLMVPEFYCSLKNHHSVLNYENVAGVSSNVFFSSHSELENEDDELHSHSNSYEALLIVTLCEYLISQGHKPSSITILTTYVGQLYLIRQEMQGRYNVKGVLATTVDNYQGEENDIILVSFVRSNIDKKVGFIKTQNRLCVALSRARKGLYCVGNFHMFALESNIWQCLLTKLSSMGFLGEKLEVNCWKHPKIKYLVSTPSDLEKHMKKGCFELCEELLHCGHMCDLLCHEENTEHSTKECDSECIRETEAFLAVQCTTESTTLDAADGNDFHNTEKKTEVLTDSEEKCRTDSFHHVNESAANLHADENKCHAIDSHFDSSSDSFDSTSSDEENVSCGDNSTQPVQINKPEEFEGKLAKNLPCGHVATLQSNSEPSGTKKFECQEIVTSHMSCGESIKHACGRKAKHQTCSYPLMLQCGHTVPCNTNLDLYLCIQDAIIFLHCGHKIVVPCHKSKDVFICEEETEITLLCGHTAIVPCCKSKDVFICEEETEITLLCGHTAIVPCCKSKDVFICEEETEITLLCGHTAIVPCCKSECKKSMKCQQKVNVILPCGHRCKILCFEQDSLNSIRCQKQCGALLPCHHRCLGMCNTCTISKNHAVCVAAVTRSLSCGHFFDTKCNTPFAFCHRRCMYRCIHGQCYNPCYVACFPCKKPCAWKCKHYRCDKLCSELCDRPPCNESCPKRNLSCGHPCSGFCGEPCPYLCQLCEGNTRNNNEKLILLEDCGHSIPHAQLTDFFKENLRSCPKCPNCNVPITKNVRFGNKLKLYYKSRNEKKLEHAMAHFPVIRFLKPCIPHFLFVEHIEMIWNELQMGCILAHNKYLSKLNVARQLNVLFCINEAWKFFDEGYIGSQKLYESMRTLRMYDHGDTRALVFRSGTLLFIQKVTDGKNMFSKIGRVNEICEDVISYLEKSPFNTDTVEKIVETVHSGNNLHCPTLMAFTDFLKELCFAIA